MEHVIQNSGTEHGWRRFARFLGAGLAWFVVSLFTLWAVAALCFDVRRIWLRIPAVSVFVLSLLAVFIFTKGAWLCLAAPHVPRLFCSGGFLSSHRIIAPGRRMFLRRLGRRCTAIW